MNDGFINELELVNYINNNNPKDYNTNIKDFLKFVFKSNYNVNMLFDANKIEGQVKPDLSITHNGITKYISVKKGSGNSVHQEKIDVFFPFIQETLGNDLLKDFQSFHYGDGTIDDSGSVRYSAKECETIYADNISRINSKINKWEILNLFLDRFLFVGNVSSTLIVDVIYHGTITEGNWASSDELKEYIKNNSFRSKSLHFGPLTYQVWGRNNNWTAVHPDRRYVMQIKWGSLKKDLNNIRENN